MLLLDIFLAQFDDTRTAVNADVAGRLRHADRMLRMQTYSTGRCRCVTLSPRHVHERQTATNQELYVADYTRITAGTGHVTSLSLLLLSAFNFEKFGRRTVRGPRSDLFTFCRAMVYISAAYAIVWCLSVCLSGWVAGCHVRVLCRKVPCLFLANKRVH